MSEMESFIQQYEIETGARYVRQKSRNLGLEDTELESIKSRTIFFEDPATKGPRLEGDGVPFIILGSELRECAKGRKRTKKTQSAKSDDHNFTKKKKMIQNTKKMGCKSKIVIRKLIKFPEYKLIGSHSKHNKSVLAKRLREQFTPSTTTILEVIVKIEGEHNDHLHGEDDGFNQVLDNRVKDFIVSLVENGCKDIDHISTRVEEFVPTIVGDESVSKSNRRFFPSRKTIYNIVYNCINSSRYVKDDQLKSKILCGTFSSKHPTDKIYFRPSSDAGDESAEPTSLLFCYQTEFQRHMLLKYGGEICVLDATYNTTKYNIPLFQLCVLTNFGYLVVGSFIVSKETTSNIAEGLRMFQDWNPHWHPKHFICDYDQREITALERVFQGIQVYLCYFHAVQCWKRWLGAEKAIPSKIKKDLVEKLQTISKSTTREEYENEKSSLTEMPVYKENENLRNWLEKSWFAVHRRWVRYTRTDLINVRINTTNGVERQHRILKENFLKKFGFGGTLENILTVLVDKFVPAMQMRYKEHNIKAMSKSRSYSEHVPSFLHDKPKSFIQHCLKRMPPKTNIEAEDAVFLSEEVCHLRSTDSGSTYTLTFNEMTPNCTCEDFNETNWPCKHILAIVIGYPSYSWDLLNSNYTNQPCFVLDEKILSSASTLQENEEDIVEDLNLETSIEAEFVSSIDSVNEARTECLEIVKNIQGSLYSIDTLAPLNEAKVTLSEIDNYLESVQPKLNSLPLRRGKARKRKSKRLAAARNKRLKTSHPKKDVPIAENVTCHERQSLETTYIEEISANLEEMSHSGPYLQSVEKKNSDEINASHSGKNKNKTYLGQKTTTSIELRDERTSQDSLHSPNEDVVAGLTEIWNTPPTDDVVVQIGPFVITRRSLHFLKTTLSDDILDASIALMVKGRNVLHLSCVVATAIFQGQGSLHGYLQNENICLYDTCIGAVNEGGHHWVLVILKPKEKSIYYLNPMGELPAYGQVLLHNWYNFLNVRSQAGIEESLVGTWSVQTIRHSKQLDGMSCGVYVIKFAENYLNGKSLLLRWNRGNIEEERKSIAIRILSAGTIPPTGNTAHSHQSQSGTSVKFNPPEGQDTKVVNGVTLSIDTRYQCITAMKEYEGKSLEELRIEYYTAERSGNQAAATSGIMFGTPAASLTEPTGFTFGQVQHTELGTPKSTLVEMSQTKDVESEEIPQTKDVESDEIPQTKDVESEEIPQTKDVESDEIPKTKDVESDEIPETKDVESEEIPQTKDVESEEIPQTKDVESEERSITKDVESEEMSQTKDIESEEMSRTKDVESEEMSQTQDVESEEMSQTKDVESEEMSQTKDVESEEMSQTKDVESEEMSLTKDVESEKMSQTKDVESEEMSQTKDVESEEIPQTKDVESEERSITKDVESEEMSQTKDIESEEMSRTKDVESEEMSQTQDVESEEMSQTKDVESEEMSQTKDVESEEMSQTKDVESEEMSLTKDVESEKMSQTKDVESEEMSQTKDVESEEMSQTKDVESEEMYQTEDIESKEMSQTKDVESEEMYQTEDIESEEMSSTKDVEIEDMSKDVESEEMSQRKDVIEVLEISSEEESDKKLKKKSGLRGIKGLTKRKMSSFIYPSLKKEKTLYCKCRQPYDGKLMICCDICSHWYHPGCLKMKETDLPKKEEHFFCSECRFFPVPDALQESFDEDTGTEDDYFINMKTVCDHLPAILARIHDIVSNPVSNKPWVKRHKLFCYQKLTEKIGYGFSLFSQKILAEYLETSMNFPNFGLTKAILCAGIIVKEKFLKTEYSGAYVKTDYIAALKDSRLKKVFEDNSYLAASYCEKVLNKEALCAIFQYVTGAEYEAADRACSEINEKSLLKAINDGLKISKQKKEEWVKKIRKE